MKYMKAKGWRLEHSLPEGWSIKYCSSSMPMRPKRTILASFANPWQQENNSNPRMHSAAKKHKETPRLSKETRNTHRLHAKSENSMQVKMGIIKSWRQISWELGPSIEPKDGTNLPAGWGQKWNLGPGWWKF